MSSCSTYVINTRLQPRDGDSPGTSRFNGLPAMPKPLKRFESSSCSYTRLKPGINENAFRTLSFALFFLRFSPGPPALAQPQEETETKRVPLDTTTPNSLPHRLKAPLLAFKNTTAKIPV